MRSVQNLQDMDNFSLSMTINNLVNRKQTIEEKPKDFFLNSIASKTKYKDKVQAYTEYKIGRKLP